MFRKLFNPDNDLMIFLSRVTDCIFLSMFFLLGCLPVVTVGASFAALYDSSLRGVRRADRQSWPRFLEVYKTNWKGSIVPSLLFLLVMCGAAGILVSLWNGAVAGKLDWTVFSVAAVLGVYVLGTMSILFPLLSRFENATGTLLKNTILLSLAHLPRSLILGLINGAAAYACICYIIPLFFLPSLAAFLSSFLLEPMFRPYMPEEETFAEEEEASEEE